MYCGFIDNDIFVRVTFLCGRVEVDDCKRGMYVFFIFYLCIVEVVVVCLGGFLFMGGGVIYSY